MNTKIINASLRTSGHYIDIENNILYLSAAFNKKSQIYGSDEYKKRIEILSAFPDCKVNIHTSSRKRVRMTYQMMVDYITIMPDSKNKLEEYRRTVLASQAVKGRYTYVLDWFEKNYPHYNDYLVKNNNGKVIWDVSEEVAKAQSEKESTSKIINMQQASNA